MASSAREIRILSNLSSSESVNLSCHPYTVTRYPKGKKSLPELLRLFIATYRFDYLLLNTPPYDLLVFAFLKYLIPFNRCRLVSMDCVLPVPRGAIQVTKAMIKALLFRKVHLFIEYFRDTAGYQRYYRIRPSKFVYVPFKVNRLERVLATQGTDQGYVFCGGSTRRDFATLFEAARGLDIPFKLVTRNDEVIREHGTELDENGAPENVEIIRHDGGDSFVDYIAGARLVAIPIRKRNISASGIGVYLAAMALGKCVVLTEGVGVSDVLLDGQAYSVPPEDPAALRRAIVLLWNNSETRSEIARRGRDYARSLGGEDRLAKSAVEILLADFEHASTTLSHS